jgi:hypothetical protein
MGFDAAAKGPGHRLPLGGEGGERPEGRHAGPLRCVGEERQGRLHPVREDPIQHAVGVSGTLDQNGIRLEIRQSGKHRPGGPRSVMPDSVHLDRSAGVEGHDTSRHAV